MGDQSYSLNQHILGVVFVGECSQHLQRGRGLIALYRLDVAF